MHAGAAKAAASRRLLVQDESLGAPDPVCQFCEMAVSYVKVCLLDSRYSLLCCASCELQALSEFSCHYGVVASHRVVGDRRLPAVNTSRKDLLLLPSC